MSKWSFVSIAFMYFNISMETHGQEMKKTEVEIGDHMDKNEQEMKRKQKRRGNGEQTDKNEKEMAKKTKMEREWRKCSIP